MLETERCMQEVLAGATGSGRETGGAGAEPGEIAGLQMEETVLMEVDVLLMPVLVPAPPPPPPVDELELDEEPALDTAGGVNWPLLSEPVLSRVGDDFFLGGRALALLPLCCCCLHLARRFLNQTWGQKEGEETTFQF